jgi:hypothetical protein
MGKIGILPKSAVIAIAGALFASILAAQEPLQLKVPYHCPDGTIRISAAHRGAKKGSEAEVRRHY